MFYKIQLYFNTLKYLKLRQIFYWVYYKLKWNYLESFINYNEYKYNALPETILFDHTFVPDSSVTRWSFTFHGKRKDFDFKIDWNFKEYGKLWNYQLQYLQYLLDENIPVRERIEILKDISSSIITGTLKLEPYPVSLRLIGTLIFVSENKINDQQILLAVNQQICYLEKNLEYHLSANHLLENYISLCFSFAMVGDDSKFQSYFNLLIKELRHQIYNDGGHYERTPTYHAVLLYRMQLLYIAMERKPDLSFQLMCLKAYIIKMQSWYKNVMACGKKMPLLNDSTENDTPSLDFLLSFSVKRKFDIPDLGFSDSGFKRLTNNYFEVIINCGAVTPSFQPGHAHADLLHFVLYLNGKPILVDTGISTYERNSTRLEQRSTNMHNTVTCGNSNQSEIWAAFRMAKRAKIHLIHYSNERIEANVIWHNGFIHKRIFLLKENLLQLEDFIVYSPDENEKCYANFHFHFENKITKINNDIILSDEDHIELRFNGHNNLELQNYRQAFNFNTTIESHKATVQFNDKITTTIKYTP